MLTTIIKCLIYKKNYGQINTLKNYGQITEFKVGIHYGKVTLEEIGVVKKDIVFSGDVLNTAARIQSMCNELGGENAAIRKLTKYTCISTPKSIVLIRLANLN